MILFLLGIAAFIFGLVAIIYGAVEREGFSVGTGIVAFIVAAILIIWSLFVSVPTGFTGIMTTFGEISDKTIEAGLNTKAPWQEIVLMDNREQKTEFKFLAFSKDMQNVTVEGYVSHQIDPKAAMTLYRTVGKKYYEVLVPSRLEETGRVLISQNSAEELIANRESIAPQLTEALRNVVKPYGLNIISISLDLDFEDKFTDAIEAKQVATQELLKAQTQQEQKTMEAQQQAERQKIEAQAKADIAKLEADAEAYAVKTKADAEAEANKKISQSLTEELIKYMETNQWNGTLPSTYIGGDSNALPIISAQ